MIFDENTIPPRNIINVNDMGKKGAKKTIEEIYQKKTQLEHILLRPDTYVGSVERQTQNMWVLDRSVGQIVSRQITFVPGLYKIFDEIIVNASDNKQRDPTMSRIDVTIDPDRNMISVWNNGKGIPVVIHQEHKIHVPELIFGNLLTGSNFNDDEEKTTGGRNGYGAKLANIFSLEFTVETQDSETGLKFKQTFRKNMSERSEPEIKKISSGSDFTCITFKPDLARFKMDSLDDDIVALLSKRVYDIAATTFGSGAKLSVSLNGSKIETKTFEKYMGIYAGLEPICAFEKTDRWEVGVGLSDGSFQQVSYVNSISTTKGGQHVNHIADQIANRLLTLVKKKNKGQEVKLHQIKNHFAVYVNALIVNPAFDSQTKETLTTKASNFGSSCVLSEKFLKQVEKSGIVDNIIQWAQYKQTAELKKKGGSKRAKLTGIVKLDDANFAGTSKSRDCTLILTEGDSAKALAISGLGVVGRDYYGVFPLKGKLLNVREASHSQIMKNEEVQNIAQILGLSFGKQYEDVSSLRYGHLMIMTDQDHDGSHIKGLLINFLHHFWPSLLHIPGFLQQFITPIVKCFKGHKEQVFYTMPEYQSWREAHNEGKGWRIKYYKGLGTSTAAEAKDYFSNLPTHEIDFAWDEQSTNFIELAFSKKRVDDRKQWLLSLKPGTYINYAVDSITYDKFINHELILFSHADNQRSIPHVMDGFKPSQRKVLFSCFKRNLRQEIKVAQLAGYISEHSAYHHGEMSLTQTIIGMAQNFVGSNNINLLSPCGQFGTRLMGGKDAASPRYVFTKLEEITRKIFHPDDDALLDYLDDDGQSIEPVCYVPVIPMVLVNGSDGIGTGWSSSVPTYDPRQIIRNLRKMINGEGLEEMHPWFRGFQGEVRAKTGKDQGNYSVSGIIEQQDDSTVVISELPVKKWTTDYKQYLESVLIGGAASKEKETKEDGTPVATSAPFVKDFKENHTDTTVLFTVIVPPEKLMEAASADKGGLMKKFKLETSVATTNMHMFDLNGQIHKYESPVEILNTFYGVRLEFYEKRRVHLIEKLTDEWDKLDNKVRFILMVIAGELVVSNRKKIELLKELRTLKFKTFKSTGKGEADATDSDSESRLSENSGSTEEEDDISKLAHGYDYLLSMKIWSLTMERVQALTAERNLKYAELEDLRRKSPSDLWLKDLDELELALDAFEGQFEEAKLSEEAARRKAKKNVTHGKKVAKARKPVKKAAGSDDDDDDEMDDFIVDDEDDGSDYENTIAKKAKKKTVPKAAGETAAPPAAAPKTKLVQQLLYPKAAEANPIAKSSKTVKEKAKPVVPKEMPMVDLTQQSDDLSEAKPSKAVKKPRAKVASRAVYDSDDSSMESDGASEDFSGDDDEDDEDEYDGDSSAGKGKSKTKTVAKATSKGTVAKQTTSQAKTKPVATLKSRSELENVDGDVENAKSRRTARPVKKINYNDYDDDGDEEMEWDGKDSDEDDGGSVGEDSDVDSELSDVEKTKPKPKAKKIMGLKEVASETGKGKSIVGRKRAPKLTSPVKIASDEDRSAAYSPEPPTPKEVKKAKRAVKTAKTDEDIFSFQSSSASQDPVETSVKSKGNAPKKTTKAANKAPTTASTKEPPVRKEVEKPKAKKAAVSSKRKVIKDDDDDEEEDDVIIISDSPPAPKSFRQRKPVSYKDEDDDSDENDDSDYE